MPLRTTNTMGTAYSIFLFAVVIASGLLIGHFKIKGISIGATWILFVAILLSHFGLRPDPTTNSFMQELGLILFIFSIGLQVGPGFFSSFKKGGVKLNMLAAGMIILAGICTFVIHLVSGERLDTMVGVMSGAVTNTPGLGAAEQTYVDAMTSSGMSAQDAANASTGLASAYAVAYPLGIIGVLAVLILFKKLFKVDLSAEHAALQQSDPATTEQARRMHCEVSNPAIFGKSIDEVLGGDMLNKLVISRMMRGGVEFIPGPEVRFEKGDKLLIVTSQQEVDRIRIIFGEEIPMHLADWKKQDEVLVSRKLCITRKRITGKKLSELHFRTLYGVSVTRIIRSGVELVAQRDFVLQMGDAIQVVGPSEGIAKVEKIIGNKTSLLEKPNLIPIFFGIALGIVLGTLPLKFPGIPQPVKLGLAGGPLVISILLGAFGPRLRITTYTTQSANSMIQEIGICFFLAAVGFGAGANFVGSLCSGGWWWILYGAIITIVPVLIIGLLARYAFKLNFFQICGLLSGGMTSPSVLAFAKDAYGSEYTAVNYATVYPLSMFLRVVLAQVMILLAI